MMENFNAVPDFVDDIFNIVGDWDWTQVDYSGITTTGKARFSGSKSSGIVNGNITGGSGDYSVFTVSG